MSEGKTTLALNMIIGAGEANEMNRCLESVCIEGLFDEIVIVLTSTDLEIRKVAEKFTKKIYDFKWIDDFAAARNEALKHTKCEHVMWLDADDVIEELARSRLMRMKEYISNDNHDIYLIPYNLVYDEEGTVLQFIPRDRVFKRRRGIKWYHRVHEQLITKNHIHSVAVFNGISVEHKPVKESTAGIVRNLKILEEEYLKDTESKHYGFFYARDLMITNSMEKALAIFDDLIRERTGTADNLFSCASNIAMYYTYDNENSLKTETIDVGENYARIALSFSEKYAEPYVLLGDIYRYKGMLNECIEFYKMAMAKKLDGYGLQQTEFYEQIPAQRLSEIYEGGGEFTSLEQALYYNKLALSHSKSNEHLLKDKKRILNKIIDKGD